MIQWLRLRPPNAEGLGSIPGLGPRSHMPQLRVCMPAAKDQNPRVPWLRPEAAK